MRSACRAFVDTVQTATERDHQPRQLWVAYQPLDDREVPLVTALGELRSNIGVQVGLVAATFGLDLPDSLVAILPPPPEGDDGRELDFDLRRPW
jgi:hypothetical protein